MWHKAIMHSSQLITFPTQLCLVLYFFCTSLLHLLMWLTVLPLFSHNLSSLFVKCILVFTDFYSKTYFMFLSKDSLWIHHINIVLYISMYQKYFCFLQTFTSKLICTYLKDHQWWDYITTMSMMTMTTMSSMVVVIMIGCLNIIFNTIWIDIEILNILRHYFKLSF